MEGETGGDHALPGTGGEVVVRKRYLHGWKGENQPENQYNPGKEILNTHGNTVDGRGGMVYKRRMDANGFMLEVLKWVVLVFAAGFVGYFGKYLGIQLISRLKSAREAQAVGPDPARRGAPEDTTPPDGGPGDRESTFPDEDGPARGSISGAESIEPEKIGEKLGKERLKQEKKAVKAELKRRKKEPDNP